MPPEKDERAILFDMLEFAREVVSFIEGRTRQDLDLDRTLLRALERTLELVGECARKVPESVRLAHTAVPWKAMVGMRNITAHEYGRVNLDLVWRTAHRDMPPLVSALEEIVARTTAMTLHMTNAAVAATEGRLRGVASALVTVRQIPVPHG